VFFLKGEQFVAVRRVLATGTSPETVAMESLLAGPTATERGKGINSALPPFVTLVSVTVKATTATVQLGYARTPPTAFDISLRPARAAQIVYTLTAIPGIKQVLIRVNGVDRARFEGSTLAVKGALDQHDLSKPVTLPSIPAGVPSGSAPADPAGVQRRLIALHYLPADAVSGRWDYRTSQAVMAFQAWQGIDRDGSVGAQTLAELETASTPKPATTGTGKRMEVYRGKGVTLLVDGPQVTLAVHSSSGAAGYETPVGTYSIFRKERNSWSYPYQVWLPYASYFNAGIAFHASADVPANPASHGCIRLPVPEAAAVYEFAAIGTPVTVY
jgi:lipoprotein-anchoring transpeptidase ErfK/SrfK